MELASASSVAISLKIVGTQLYQTWRAVAEAPIVVEELYEMCKRYHTGINTALATSGDHECVVLLLLDELENLEAEPDTDTFIGDEVALLLDSVRLCLTPKLTAAHFETQE
jgi:hypothetical protein